MDFFNTHRPYAHNPSVSEIAMSQQLSKSNVTAWRSMVFGMPVRSNRRIMKPKRRFADYSVSVLRKVVPAHHANRRLGESSQQQLHRACRMEQCVLSSARPHANSAGTET